MHEETMYIKVLWKFTPKDVKVRLHCKPGDYGMVGDVHNKDASTVIMA